MTPSAFEARWRHDLDHAEKTLIKDGHVAPLFIIVGLDGQSSLIPAVFPDAETKARYFDVARMQAIAVDAEAVLLRTESWLVAGDLADGIGPAQSDRRIEVVSVTATVRLGRKISSRLSVREIVRDDQGRAVGLRDVPMLADSKAAEGAKGPMFELLPSPRPSRKQQQQAAVLVESMKAGA